ncbi:hypothetical protein [Saccharopolyspora phatthalungensis]|uniref:CRP-like cAMP-binding protein n=1 Tax=Saccharopolyspora phatthalungensis TaxID=664693 RepID=A0A840Q054_9PSEU|nr:hypothetical protein [Saccharopolyspora phatthalungensis]MBB5155912.1 CRP-like cAMP-binding protein [Saccharopolyspora phatthalungensis]
MDNTQTSRLGRYLDGLVARAPAPPQDVLARPITAADVAAYPVYFIHGPGRDIAQNTLCAHDYTLVDSCPGCDADDPP